MNSFKVNRDLPEGRYQLREIFSGLGEVEPLKRCISNPKMMKKIMEETFVSITPDTRYMYVNDEDGSLVVALIT